MVKSRRFASETGALALSTLLGITLIVSVLATGIALLTFFEGLIGFSHALANDAYLASRAGVYDALRRIAWNKSFSSSGYTMPVGSGTATVVVESFGWGGPPQHTRISSTGDVQNRKRKLQVVVYVDAATGATRIVSWKEVTI